MTDLRAPEEEKLVGVGPMAQALEAFKFQEVILLGYFAKPEHQEKIEPYLQWLWARSEVRPTYRTVQLQSPTDFSGIYETARRVCAEVTEDKSQKVSLTFHLSPGSPAMAAVWILLAKTLFPAELIESSREMGARLADVPFNISAEFLPDLLREADEKLRQHSSAESPQAPEFDAIIHRSEVMKRLLQRARRVALRNVPVLIEGESGTGKEMLARAIHRASARKDKPFVPVNCGAISESLVESALFGHKRGAFTGAFADQLGHIRAAHGGTLFLDEVGELPLPVQVKLLRPLQEGKVQPVGSSDELPVDVRILAATNRTISDEVANGRFREDLFYRLAVAVLRVPPLRERQRDLELLLDKLLEQVNTEAKGEPGYEAKKLSIGAKNLLRAHSWPGNVRELLNTLKRAAIWSEGPTITENDAREALLPIQDARRLQILERPFGGGFRLETVLNEVAQHYLKRALHETGGNKTHAAKLVGASSPQTFSNWLKSYEVAK